MNRSYIRSFLYLTTVELNWYFVLTYFVPACMKSVKFFMLKLNLFNTLFFLIIYPKNKEMIFYLR